MTAEQVVAKAFRRLADRHVHSATGLGTDLQVIADEISPPEPVSGHTGTPSVPLERQIKNLQGWLRKANEERDEALRRELDVKLERDRWQRECESACAIVAKMHAAAVGEVRGATVGVIEDVEALRKDRDRLRSIVDSIASVIGK